MSIRCIWVISTVPENLGKVLFFRKFPTVELRAQRALHSNYIGIPSEEEFSLSLLVAVGLSPESNQFVRWRDKASKGDMCLPLISVKVKERELWPILIVEQLSCLLCCLPHVEGDHKDVFHIPSVSIGYSVLIGILNFLGPNTTYIDEAAECFTELDNYLTISMPFGTPSDIDCSSVVAFYNESPILTSKQQQDTLKQASPKAKPLILIKINEYVRSAQGDHHGFQPIVEVYGSINIKLKSLSHVNEMSIGLEHSTVGRPLYLDSIIVHPCVQSFTSGGTGASSVLKKFWLIPLLHRFMLCFYSAHCTQPPISGIFKMKGRTTIELLIHVKLNENVTNSFNSCEVYIPFFHRGPIINFEFKATQGFMYAAEDRHSLKWNIGSKFSEKSLDAFLTGKVNLNAGPISTHDDSFCVGTNAYIQILFKRYNETLSGCSIDPKSVTLSPPQRAKIVVESSVESTEYRIWNSFGNFPFPIVPKENWPKE